MNTDEELSEAGWQQVVATDFNHTAGPYWFRRGDAGLEIAFRSEQRHSNGHLGIVHGGAMMSFADVALGCLINKNLGCEFIATVQLSYSFTAAARLGTLITCRPELVRRTSSLVFVRGMIEADGRNVGSAEGIWKILEPEKAAALRG